MKTDKFKAWHTFFLLHSKAKLFAHECRRTCRWFGVEGFTDGFKIDLNLILRLDISDRYIKQSISIVL